MSLRRIWYISYLHPKTGFLKREQFDSEKDQRDRMDELRRQGVEYFTKGSYIPKT